jgi:hypothetical protein
LRNNTKQHLGEEAYFLGPGSSAARSIYFLESLPVSPRMLDATLGSPQPAFAKHWAGCPEADIRAVDEMSGTHDFPDQGGDARSLRGSSGRQDTLMKGLLSNIALDECICFQNDSGRWNNLGMQRLGWWISLEVYRPFRATGHMLREKKHPFWNRGAPNCGLLPSCLVDAGWWRRAPVAGTAPLSSPQCFAHVWGSPPSPPGPYCTISFTAANPPSKTPYEGFWRCF